MSAALFRRGGTLVTQTTRTVTQDRSLYDLRVDRVRVVYHQGTGDQYDNPE